MEQMILAAEQKHLAEAKAWKLPLAHMAYTVGNGGHLLRYRFPTPPQGGLMVIHGEELSGSSVESLGGEILRECMLRKFCGVVCRFPRKDKDKNAMLVRYLNDLCGTHGLSLYVPEAYGGLTQANVLISTALSGGSYRERIGEAVGRFTAGRIALWVECVREDFPLPCPSGSGQPLTQEEFELLREEQGSATFFSRDLCAHYFTYRTGERGHFVLFDNAGSIRKKLSIAGELSVTTAFLPYPSVKTMLGELLA